MADVWNRANLLWVAGLYEGEGSCTAVQKSRNSINLQVKILMTDLDVLESVRETLGVGRIYGPYVREGKDHWKPHYIFTAYGNEAYALAIALFPLMHARRKAQIIQAVGAYLQAFKDRPSVDDRFWKHVTKLENGCWVWSGGKTSRVGPEGRRYGQFSLAHTKATQAHSYVFRINQPDAPKNIKLKPTCATSLCVRHWEKK